jgi:hypothetical protein
MYMLIEREKQTKAVDRARRANITSVEKAEALVAKYREQLYADRSEKNQRLVSWAVSVLLGVKILSGEVRSWIQIDDSDEYEHQDKLSAMGVDV